MIVTYLGDLLALGCALTWAISVIYFKRASEMIHPYAINIFKNGFSLIFFIPAIFLFEYHSFSISFSNFLSNKVLILLLSGLLGIGIADALFFKGLKMISASRVAILECSYSPCVILISVWLFSEVLTPLRMVGALLVVGAVIMVSYQKELTSSPRAVIIKGSLLTVVAVILTAIGVMLVKPFFSEVPLFWMIEIRLVSGFVFSLILGFVLKERKAIIGSLLAPLHSKYLIIASFFGTYLGMAFWIAGFKYTSASSAAILNQMGTIFTVILAALILKEKMTPLKLAGTVLATLGAILTAVG